MGEALQGGRSDCGCAFQICSDLLGRFRGFCGSNPCISVGFLDGHIKYYLLTWGNVPLVIPLTYPCWMGGTFIFFI